MISDALTSREGQLYTGGAAAAFLLALALLVSGVEDYQRQWAYREAVEAAAQGRAEAGQLLRSLRQELPSDPTPRVLLGAYEYRRARDLESLDTARLLFEEALERDRSRTSAIVGLLATRLRMAALKEPEARTREAEEVARLSDDLAREAYEPRHPDLLTVQAAARLLAGRTAEALASLQDVGADGLLPSRDGAGARQHALAAARILMRQPGAIEPATLAWVLRNGPRQDDAAADGRGDPDGEPGRLVPLAYRLELADPRVEPATPEALAQRAERAAALLPRNLVQLGPDPATVPRAAAPAIANALGIAWYRAQRYAEASAAFEQASSLSRGAELLYLLNLGQAAYRAGLAAPEGSPERDEQLTKAVKSYVRLCERLARQEGREGTLALALTNAAAIALRSGNARGARDLYRRFMDHRPGEAIRARDMGALEEHAGAKRAAAELYRKAIELRHPDTDRLQQRLRQIER